MKKKKKTNSSSNPINGSDSSTFHVSIATAAVAQICHSIGFKSTQTTALQTLTDITVRYLTSLATSAATSAASTGRTECNLYDVIRGMEDVHADVGFNGNSVVTRRLSSLSDSEMLKDMMRFVHWSREVPFAKPLRTVTSSSSASYPMEEKNAVPRGKVMVTSLNGESNGNENIRKRVLIAVNEGKSEGEAVPRGKRLVTSLYGESNGNENVRKKVFTAVNEGKSEGEAVPRGKQIVMSLCENEKLNRKRKYCGEKEAVNEEGEKKRKKEVPRGKQMLTSLYGECNGNEKLNHLGNSIEKRFITAVNEGKSEGEVMPRGKQIVTCEKSEMRHVPKWLPDFPDCGEKVVFTAEVNDEGKKNESEKEKVNYYHKEVSELPEVRKKVRFEIRGKSRRVKDVIKVKCRGVDLRSGICKGGKRILCQIYQNVGGKKYGNKGDYDVVKTSMVKMKSARR
nr:transcription initiation factor TFIID subunit 8-like [Tanacetum cinerariifolium]